MRVVPPRVAFRGPPAPSGVRVDGSPMLSVMRDSMAFLLLSSSRRNATCAFNSAIISSFASRRASRLSLWDAPSLRTPNTDAMFSSLRCSIFGSVKHFWHIARKNFLLRKMLRWSGGKLLESYYKNTSSAELRHARATLNNRKARPAPAKSFGSTGEPQTNLRTLHEHARGCFDG